MKSFFRVYLSSFPAFFLGGDGPSSASAFMFSCSNQVRAVIDSGLVGMLRAAETTVLSGRRGAQNQLVIELGNIRARTGSTQVMQTRCEFRFAFNVELFYFLYSILEETTSELPIN